MTEFALVPKIMPSLRRLRIHYQNKGEEALQALIDAASVYVEPGTDFDNWNGGTYGHDVHLFVGDADVGLVDLDSQSEILDRIRDDLNKATSYIENEFVRAVHFSAEDSSDPQSQAATPFTSEPRAQPDQVGLWIDNYLRVFISHRDGHKAVAHELADALLPYGISCFVAHDAIKPMREWQNEIMNGLATMEVMLVLLTDDFHDSQWTDQEVGYALGKGIPIISMRIGKNDPKGFIGAKQAMPADLSNMPKCIADLHRVLVNEIGQEGRLKTILIEAFINSVSFPDSIENLTRLVTTTDRLTDQEFNRIVKGYENNDQLHNCGGIHNRGNWFKRYLENASGKKLKFDQRKIVEIEPPIDNEIPW